VVLNSRWAEKYYHFRALVCFSTPLKNKPLKYAKFILKARVHSCTLTVLHSVMFIFQSENRYQNFPVLGSNSSEKDLAFESYCVSKQRQDTRWFKYDRDWFVCKKAALRSSCATLREWSHNLHPPSCSG